MMLVVGWWESDMTAKHTQKIRAMDSGVLLTAYIRCHHKTQFTRFNRRFDHLTFHRAKLPIPEQTAFPRSGINANYFIR
jgi:hypothetical protein